MSVGFAEAFSRLRKEKGISQRQAAADLGISQALLSHYEKGIREPKLDFIVRACEYYSVSADFLLGRSSAKSNPLAEFHWEDENVTRLMDSIAALLDRLAKDGAGGDALRYFESAVYKLCGESSAEERALCESYMALSEARISGKAQTDNGELNELLGEMRKRLMDYKR